MAKQSDSSGYTSSKFVPMLQTDQNSMSVNGVPLEWDYQKGTFKIHGIESIFFWANPSLTFLFRPLVEEIGIHLFRLIVASSASKSVREDYDSILDTNFERGFRDWASLMSIAGWGSVELLEYEPSRCHAVVCFTNPWELSLQADLPQDKCWGCPFLQGKIIGVFEKALGQTCWASEAFDKKENTVTFTVYASEKSIEDELAVLRRARSSEQEQQLYAQIDAKTRELQDSTTIINNAAELDFLTNLNNRLAFENKLTQLIKNNTWEYCTLLLVNLDQFKIINDTCGHLSGDRLLTMVSEQLTTIVGSDRHMVYRYGGDEFAVLLSTPDTDLSIKFAHKIRETISNVQFDWEQRIYQVSCSIGMISLAYIEPREDAAIIAADDACRQAKDKGRNQVHVGQALDYHVQNRLTQMNWVHRIKEALANDQFEIHFQEIKSLGDEKGLALEALIRMIDSQNDSLIMPLSFLPAAERYGVVFEVDCWVIKHVFQKLQSLKHSNSVQSVAINLSGHTLSNPNLGGFINHCFNQYQVEPSQICFELTETHMMMNLETAKGLLTGLRKRGCTISLDDFGAGMSSFGYLRDLPVDKIKIDGSFVKNMHDSAVEYTFVESIANVARVMQIQTVAEFVENERIVEQLKELKVDFAQGYHIAEPAPWDELFA